MVSYVALVLSLFITHLSVFSCVIVLFPESLHIFVLINWTHNGNSYGKQFYNTSCHLATEMQSPELDSMVVGRKPGQKWHT